jgi:DinB superfamily
MAKGKAEELAGLVRQKLGDFLAIAKDLDEETASRAPEGRWSAKQIVSHISGPDGIGYLPMLQGFLDQDTPRFDIEAENPYLTDRRAQMPFAALLAEFEKEYSRIADFAAGLSADQLNRKAHVPLLKETPLGEYPTLAEWIFALMEYHVVFHIDHLKEIRGALEM